MRWGIILHGVIKRYVDHCDGVLRGGEQHLYSEQASGGIVLTEHFEKLWSAMLESGSSDEGSPRKRRKIEKTTATQKNTLDGWMKRS